MAQIDSLPPLRDVIASHGLSARKALGQNFLLDLNLTSRIARSAGSLEGYHIIEIGPGPGGLTRAILAAGAVQVTAIEMDERCLPALEEISTHYPGQLTVHLGDALKHDMRELAQGRKTRIIANLPYNVASPLIINWLQAEPWPPWYESITVMVQKEYAERLVATTDERKDYGRLSILTGWRAEAKIMFHVPPSAFVPQPKVMSSVVQLIPRASLAPCRMKTLERITQAAFGQRRKMLRQSLKSLGCDVAELLRLADIAPEARAEEIDIAGFLRMANTLDEL
ncbi:MAG: 16S rRNA (adenine(1518)-N(6)/adenine(1519)-N(6))-dimethyltransferase RsmA [Beijerinckiaceae bacterium]